MSAFTLKAPAFPEGTSVGAYPASAWPNPGQPSGAPLGSATNSQTMTSGTLTFTGLTAGQQYWAVAQVDGTYRYIGFIAASDVAAAQVPKPHASTHQPGGSDAMAVDAAAGTGSLRTLGAAAGQAAVGSTGALDANVFQSHLAPDFVGPFHPTLYSTTSTHPVNRIRMVRCVIPKTGHLRDLAIFPTVQAGNVIVAVYDTGDASAGNRSLLWASGTVAVPAANAWGIIGDPNLAVTRGQQIELAFMGSDATFATPRMAAINTNQYVLPTGFYSASGGASPKLASDFSAGSFAMPSTLAEGSCNANSAFAIIARIS